MKLGVKIGLISAGALIGLPLLFGGAKSTANKAVSVAQSLIEKYRGIKENSPAFNEILTAFWRNVGYSESAAKAAIKNKTPWSAAFISYCFKDYPDFPKSGSHSYYIVDSRTNEKNGTGNFRLKRINQYKPKVGDLVCKSRSGVNTSYDSIEKGTISHCDLVVGVTATELITIGGNVSDSISVTNVPIKDGYINKSGYFAVIQNLH